MPLRRAGLDVGVRGRSLVGRASLDVSTRGGRSARRAGGAMHKTHDCRLLKVVH
jgi:hypothetical protein